jgi:hypothetical protein
MRAVSREISPKGFQDTQTPGDAEVMLQLGSLFATAQPVKQPADVRFGSLADLR